MAVRFSSYFFLRSYVAIAAAILFVALALDGIMVWLTVPPRSALEIAYGSDLMLIESMLDSSAKEAPLDAAFNELKPQFESALGAPLNLYDIADIANDGELLSALQSQNHVTLLDSNGKELLYRRVSNSKYILALGPISIDTGSSASSESLVIIAYYVLVSCVLFLWIRPFYRDLSALRKAAGQFGRDDFSARVEVDTRSSIRPVAESFNKMADRIQFLVTAHRDLTNAVSHELRTPLARFKFSLEILQKSRDPAKAADYLTSMKMDVQELEELIDEMLTYAKLGEENLLLSQTSIPLDKWLERQVAQYSAGAIRARCQFDNSDSLVSTNTDCNPDMLGRALHNVLRNCMRYAQTSLLVSGSLTAAQAEIRVCDDGPGIPDDKHETVFEPFSRLDTSRDRQSGGYGLGLAIARRALQRHGGDIRVENNTPHGACFVLWWPRQQRSPSPEPTAS